MLTDLKGVCFAYTENQILQDINFTVLEGERIGLIGPNGVGKTTLLKLISGELSPDKGTVALKSGMRLGVLQQTGGYESGRTVINEMREVFRQDYNAVSKLETLSQKLATSAEGSKEYLDISSEIERLNRYIASRDSYNVEVRIRTVLNGMSFAGMYDQVIDSMSGGEKTRLKLARLLLESPDLLILDEPTNHLDISSMFWLEDYLKTFKGAVLVVSHDRYFLDATCSKIAEIENCRLSIFPGNYTKYKELKAAKTERLIKEYEAKMEELRKLQDYVDRNLVRATTAKSAQSRVKQIERIGTPEKPYIPPDPPKYSFKSDYKPYEKVLEITSLDLWTGGRKLISGVQLDVTRGDRLAIVGRNGTGKTTLMKAILAGENPAIQPGRNVQMALYDQEGLNLNRQEQVLYELWGRHMSLTQTEVRGILARGGLFAEDMMKKVGELSGGETAKLGLCVLECEGANVLLLDEPTNHLDLDARESLEQALKAYDGTVIFVSHDRYLLSALATRVAEIEDGHMTVYNMDYAHYIEQKKLAQQDAAAAESAPQSAKQPAYNASKPSAGSYRSKEERAQEARARARIKDMEKRITDLEAEEASLNGSLADPAVLADYRKVQKISARLDEIRTSLEALYEEYGEMV
ncbi:MAG: ABC-F family ATP-binding cassette domain-containing protein [Clostridia bacterium]|nr:ABC-F family ATP-binding cassette domain-containing protein [Clostridia bacterium]